MNNTKHLGTDFGAMFDEMKKLIEDGDNENVIAIVAKADGRFHVITDIETPMTTQLAMMQGAAQAIWESKRARVENTKGAPEAVES